MKKIQGIVYVLSQSEKTLMRFFHTNFPRFHQVFLCLNPQVHLTN